MGKNRVFSMVGENEEELTKLVDVIDIEDLSQIIYRETLINSSIFR